MVCRLAQSMLLIVKKKHTRANDRSALVVGTWSTGFIDVRGFATVNVSAPTWHMACLPTPGAGVDIS